MPYLTALALDRANEWLVRWRLRGRLPRNPGEPVVEHLRALGDRVHPAPETLPRLEPSPVDDVLWQADAPWPGARGNNARWYAEVRAADTSSSSNRGSAAVILLHGWLIDRPQLLVYRHWARCLVGQGVDVWMPRLPYHLERTDPGEVSGQRCLSPDLSTTLDAVRQSVAETRLLARWLRQGGTASVGLWGMSLGGWVAALAATLDADWDAVALWAPVASPAEVLFESRLVELLRTAVVEGGLSERDFVAPELAWMTPAERDIRVPRNRVLLVAGAYDQVVAPRSIARVARRWNVDVRWVAHGHISLMASRAPVRETAEFLGRTLACA